MRRIAMAGIGIYKRFVSPHKGFCCAYRTHTGRASCSTLGSRAIRRFGLVKGTAVLQARLARCGEVHRARPSRVAGRGAGQRGDCDCGGCDFGGCDLGGLNSDTCDCSDCGDCGDWGSQSNRKKAKKRNS